MTPKMLCPELGIDKQIAIADVAEAKKMGFRSIINNRPDGEEAGQPSSAEIERAAKDAGLAYVRIPVVPGQVGEQQIAAFAQALEHLPQPILAYCKTGLRAGTLWALSNCGKRQPDQILEITKRAGCDLSALEQRLRERSAKRSGVKK